MIKSLDSHLVYHFILDHVHKQSEHKEGTIGIDQVVAEAQHWIAYHTEHTEISKSWDYGLGNWNWIRVPGYLPISPGLWIRVVETPSPGTETKTSTLNTAMNQKRYPTDKQPSPPAQSRYASSR